MQIMDACLQQEQTAYKSLMSAWGSIPTKTATYCDQVSSSTGGAYQILAACIKQEINAANATPVPQ